MAKKVLGYQIVNAEGNIPDGLYSFQVFKAAEDAFRYLREHELNRGVPIEQCWFVQEYYEGDIEDPTYIENDKKKVKKFQVTLYYHTNVTVEVFAENEQEAKTNAYIEAAYHSQELLDGLEEDSAPDVCEDEDE